MGILTRSLVGFMALGVAGLALGAIANITNSFPPEKPKPPDSKTQAINNLDFEFHPTIDGFGNVLVVKFVFKNNNSFSVKDIDVICDSFGNSGTMIGHKTSTIYEVIKGKSSKTVTNFNMGLISTQSSKIGCHIAGLKMQ